MYTSFLVSGRDLACQQEVSLALTKTPPILYCNVVDSAFSNYHRRLAHPVVHQMSLHPDYHQWATGGPPDVATSSGPPDVALAVGTRMLACGCNADADIKWPTGYTHPVVHPMCTHAVVHRMRTSTGHEDVRC